MADPDEATRAATIPEGLDLGDVRLRQLDEGDVDTIMAAVDDAELVRFTRVPAPYSRELAREFVAAVRPRPGQPLTTFAIDHRPAGSTDVGAAATGGWEFAGVIGLDIDARDGNAEIGYWLTRSARGHGIGTRALRALSGHAFDHLGVARLHLVAAVDNTGSNVMARKVGYTHEGIARGAHLYRDLDGRPLGRGDMHIWGLLPGELT